MSVTADKVREMDLTPRSITAFLVGLKSKLGVFSLQRAVNTYRREPLLAILPGVALQELWTLMGTAETALAVISAFLRRMSAAAEGGGKCSRRMSLPRSNPALKRRRTSPIFRSSRRPA